MGAASARPWKESAPAGPSPSAVRARARAFRQNRLDATARKPWRSLICNPACMIVSNSVVISPTHPSHSSLGVVTIHNTVCVFSSPARRRKGRLCARKKGKSQGIPHPCLQRGENALTSTLIGHISLIIRSWTSTSGVLGNCGARRRLRSPPRLRSHPAFDRMSAR